jgi:hypothetical protein
MHWRVFFLLCLGACSSAARPAQDAEWDSVPWDTRLPGDTAPPIPMVDFSVAQCPNIDVQKGTCNGTAPFTIQFVSVASSGISTFQWNFGDGPATGDGQAPWHTFVSPGTYDITLQGLIGDVGVVKQRIGFIEVLPSPAGSPCSLDQQCVSNTCLCSTEKSCGYGPVNGFCSSSCQKTSCSDDQVCVNLATTATGTRAEPWQTQVCVPSCGDDKDCPAGLSCRALPAWPNAVARVKGCFVDVPAEMGSSCVDATNILRNDLCFSGLCADMGALGLCSRDCSSAACPVGSDCAVFGDGRMLCLLPCTPTFRCDADPLLLCVPAGSSQLGFQIQSSGNSGSVYCAPKPCTANTDCGASGRCVQASGGGHCVSRYR